MSIEYGLSRFANLLPKYTRIHKSNYFDRDKPIFPGPKSNTFKHVYHTIFSHKDVHDQTLYVECKDLTNHVI